MGENSTTQSVMFKSEFGKPLFAQFNQPTSSSDGGAILLSPVDQRLGLTGALASCLSDSRDPAKVKHSLLDLLRQRVFGIACGYEDCNDTARLKHDAIQKLLLGRDPVSGEVLASQATLSRFENALDARDLLRMNEALANVVIDHHRSKLGPGVKRVTIDLDVTDDATHGAQQLAFFNAHYGTYCYLPLAGFLQFDDEPEQHLFALMLRPGNAPAKKGATALLRRVFARLREAFPRAVIRVRLDGGFSGPDMLEFLETQQVEYVVAMGKNPVLSRLAEPLMSKARARSEESGESERYYGEATYQARSWRTARRVVFKAEVARLEDRAPKDNDRFVISNIPADPETVYDRIYCQRGEVENRLKELHYGLAVGRLSCSSFLANQLRLTLTAAAYVLMQELRCAATTTSLQRAQVSTIRERLFKLGAWIKRSTRRITLHLPAEAPWQTEWCRIARRLGALGT